MKLNWNFQISNHKTFGGEREVGIFNCVVPENIHTPTMEGISDKTPCTSPEFLFVCGLVTSNDSETNLHDIELDHLET